MPRGKPNPPLTEEEKIFIKENVKGTSAKEMAKILTEKFGLPRSKTQILNYRVRNGLHSGLDGRYNKGCVSINKGRPRSEWASPEAIRRMEKGMFKKGHIDDNSRPLKPVGTRSVRSDGYVWIKIEQPNRWREEHRLVWEKAHGPLGRYQKLIHIDGNPSNNSLDNLMIITNAECAEINKRIGLTDDREINLAVINLARLNCKMRKAKKA